MRRVLLRLGVWTAHSQIHAACHVKYFLFGSGTSLVQANREQARERESAGGPERARRNEGEREPDRERGRDDHHSPTCPRGHRASLRGNSLVGMLQHSQVRGLGSQRHLGLSLASQLATARTIGFPPSYITTPHAVVLNPPLMPIKLMCSSLWGWECRSSQRMCISHSVSSERKSKRSISFFLCPGVRQDALLWSEQIVFAGHHRSLQTISSNPVCTSLNQVQH